MVGSTNISVEDSRKLRIKNQACGRAQRFSGHQWPLMALTGASTGAKRRTQCCSPLALQTAGRLYGTLEGREFQLCVWSFLCMSRLRLECQYPSAPQTLHVKLLLYLSQCLPLAGDLRLGCMFLKSRAKPSLSLCSEPFAHYLLTCAVEDISLWESSSSLQHTASVMTSASGCLSCYCSWWDSCEGELWCHLQGDTRLGHVDQLDGHRGNHLEPVLGCKSKTVILQCSHLANSAKPKRNLFCQCFKE